MTQLCCRVFLADHDPLGFSRLLREAGYTQCSPVTLGIPVTTPHEELVMGLQSPKATANTQSVTVCLNVAKCQVLVP